MGLDCIPRTTASSFPALRPPLLTTGRLGCSQPRGVSQEKTCSVQGAVGGVCTRGANFGGHGAWGRPAHSRESPAGLSGSIKTQQGQPRAKWADEGRGLMRAKPGPVREAAGMQSLVHVRQFSQSHSTKTVQVLWETAWHFLKDLSIELP